MSVRVDATSWISGAVLIGDAGLGVFGSEVPSTGESGPGYIYNDLSLPADANKEVCGRITTWPTNGVLYAYEDSSFTYTGTTDTFQYQLYVDGVAIGSPSTVYLNVGSDPRYSRPTSDDVVGAWTPSTGSTLFACIDESTYDDGDYIQVSTPSVCRMALNPVTDPGTSNGQVFSLRAKSAYGNSLKVTLEQGTTTIATRTFSSLTTSFALYDITLSGAECDALTPSGGTFNNLYLKLESI